MLWCNARRAGARCRHQAPARSQLFFESYHPKTFRERGVAAPFTTPLLAGARLRPVVARGGVVLETVIPNPAGGRGVYIVPWSERGDLCRTTVHDTRLGEALGERADLASLCPAMVRQTGWQVAAEGVAGRAAAAAAQLVLEDSAARLAIAADRLAAALTRHAAGARVEPAAFERLAGLLADMHAPDGVPARLPVLIEAVGALAPALAAWAATQAGPAGAAAQLVGGAAERAHLSALQLLRTAIGRLDDPASLLGDWLADPTLVEQALSRTEWLLDGWSRLVLLWQAALPGRAAAVLEMVALLPVWPDEAESWLGWPAGTAARMARRPCPQAGHKADPAIVVDRIARNEHLRALGM